MTEPEDDRAFLERMRRGNAALRALMAERPGSGGITGNDPSGAVTAVLGADGLPERIDLDDAWRRGVGSERLAAAVTQACNGAIQANLDVVAAAEPSAWAARLSAVFAYLGGEGPEPPDLRAADHAPAASPYMPDLSGLLADIVASDLAERAEAVAQAGPPHYSGSAAAGRLTLTLDAAGQLTCAADPEWAGRQGTEELRDAIATALAGLHAERRAAATSTSPLTRFAAHIGAIAGGYALPS